MRRLIPIRANSKIPAVAWREFLRRDPTEEELATWRRQFPNCNWAAITGIDFVVLDIDARHRGMDSLRGKVLPKTRTVLTWSGGWHFYFALPRGGCRTIPAILPGTDLKGEGGYVLVPPSTIDGHAYELAVDEPIVPMPDWLLRLVAARGRETGSRRSAGEYAGLLQGVGEGSRNDTCVRLAGWLLAHGLDPDATREILVGWGLRCRPPFSAGEVAQCVASIAGADRQQHLDRLRPVEV